MAEGSGNVVMIAVDPSSQAEYAFNYYIDTLHKPDNQVLLMHAPELSNVAARFMKGEKGPYDSWDKLWEAEQKKWKTLQEKYEKLSADKQIKAKFEVEPADKPGEAIVKASQEKKATMIVMGTRGLGSIRRTVLGSVSDYVVHHASVPVIVCRQ